MLNALSVRMRLAGVVVLATSSGGIVLAGCSDDEASLVDPPGADATAPDGAVPVDASASKDSARTTRETPVTIDVLANDTGAVGAELAIVTPAKRGSAVVERGKITYTPAEAFAGDDSFEYVARLNGHEARAEVVVTVLPSAGTVAHGQLYAVESDDDISWTDMNAAGDRVGVMERGPDSGKLVFVSEAGLRTFVEPPVASEYWLVRGLADDGTVLAQYLADGRFQGFTWKAGAYARHCDMGDGLGDCTLERMKSDGTIVGFTYDYTSYTGFVWPRGGARIPIAVDGYGHSYGAAINDQGTIIGIVDNSSDGYSGPQRCFQGKPTVPVVDEGPDAGAVSGFSVIPFTDGDPEFVQCRGVNASGVIVGAVKRLNDSEVHPRSMTDRMKGLLWHPEKGWAYVRLPFKRPTAESWRIEQLFGINAAGTIVGWYQDATSKPAPDEGTTRVTRGVTLTPIEALPGTSFADTTVDHVDGPI